MFYKNARIYCSDHKFRMGAFEVTADGRFGEVLPGREPEDAYDEARRAALEAARARAGLYADALGLRVRRIVSISEGGGFMPRPMAMGMRAMEAVAASPVSPGESTLSVNLDVVFELGR